MIWDVIHMSQSSAVVCAAQEWGSSCLLHGRDIRPKLSLTGQIPEVVKPASQSRRGYCKLVKCSWGENRHLRDDQREMTEMQSDRRYCHDVTGYDMSLILHTLLWETCSSIQLCPVSDLWFHTFGDCRMITKLSVSAQFCSGQCYKKEHWYDMRAHCCFITVGWSGVSFGPNEAVWSAEPVCSDGSVLCFRFMLTFALDSCLHFGQDFQKAAGTRPSAFSSPLSSLCTLHV